MKRFGFVAALASLLVTPPSGGRNVSAGLKLFTEGNGVHVVVFESGLGDPAEPWKSVAHAVARSARVVRYDRAGLGQSPSSRRPRSASQIASELHIALRSAHLDPPYVFVSHSAGAWYALTFAARYAGEIQALVLVDPTPTDFFERVASMQNEAERRDFAAQQDRYVAVASPGRKAEWSDRHLAAVEAECALKSIKVPIVIITAVGRQPGRNPAIENYWREAQANLARRSPNGKIVLANCGHYVQLEQPSLVIREIEAVLSRLAGT